MYAALCLSGMGSRMRFRVEGLELGFRAYRAQIARQYVKGFAGA